MTRWNYSSRMNCFSDITCSDNKEYKKKDELIKREKISFFGSVALFIIGIVLNCLLFKLNGYFLGFYVISLVIVLRILATLLLPKDIDNYLIFQKEYKKEKK